MARSAVVGGVLLALIEGVGIMITRMTAEQFKPGLYLIIWCFQRLILKDLMRGSDRLVVLWYKRDWCILHNFTWYQILSSLAQYPSHWPIAVQSNCRCTHQNTRIALVG